MLTLDNLEIELNSGDLAKFKYFSDFDNPIFILKDRYRITIIDNKFYSTCGDDEPSGPLKEEYQSKIFETMNYDFFKGCFIQKEQ